MDGGFLYVTRNTSDKGITILEISFKVGLIGNGRMQAFHAWLIVRQSNLVQTTDIRQGIRQCEMLTIKGHFRKLQKDYK